MILISSNYAHLIHFQIIQMKLKQANIQILLIEIKKKLYMNQNQKMNNFLNVLERENVEKSNENISLKWFVYVQWFKILYHLQILKNLIQIETCRGENQKSNLKWMKRINQNAKQQMITCQRDEVNWIVRERNYLKSDCFYIVKLWHVILKCLRKLTLSLIAISQRNIEKQLKILKHFSQFVCSILTSSVYSVFLYTFF